MKNKKIFSSFLIPVFVLGAIPPLTSSSFTHEQLKTVKNDLNNKNSIDSDTFATDYSIVLSLKASEKISESEAKKLMNQIVTDDYIETRLSDIVDKTAAEINTFGRLNNWSADKIESTVLDKCGTILANYNAKRAEVNSDDDYTNSDLLNYVNEQAKTLDIDAFDYYQSKTMIDSIESKYSLQLFQTNSLSTSEKLEKIAAFNSVYDTFLKFAKSRFLTSLEFNWELLNLSNSESYYTNFVQPIVSANLYSSYQDFRESTAQRQLFILAQLFTDYFKNGNLSLINDGSDFVHHIEQYSSDGYLSEENPCIHTEDLTELFSFTYDNLQGTILSLPDFDYSIPTQQKELTDDLGIITTAPISKYLTKEGSTYELGELYPGYKAHFRVSGVDYSSDDSKCDFNLEIGVSDSIRDPNDENILWTTDYIKETNSADVNPNDGVLQYSLSVKNINDKKYIASHYFYNDWTANVDSSNYDENTDEYYVDTANQRPYLDELLDRNASIVDDEYVISKESPMYLTSDDVKGIPLPEVPTSDDRIFPTLNDVAHTNQFLRFMVTDYCTEVNGIHKLALYGSWVVISNSVSVIDEEGTIDDSCVYKLPWKTNDFNDTTDGLWISYEIDKKLYDAMDFADRYAEFLVDSYLQTEPIVLKLDQPTDKSNGSTTPIQAAGKTDDLLTAKIAADAILFASVILGMIACCIEAVTKVWKVVICVLYTIADLAMLAMTIMEGIWYGIFHDAYKKIKDDILPTTKKYTGIVHEVSGDVTKNYQFLKNKRLTFAKRKQCTDSILNDFGVDEDGNTVNAKRVTKFTSWIKDLCDIYDKEYSDNVEKLTEGQFIYYWKNTPDISLAKDVLETTTALVTVDAISTIGVAIPNAAGPLLSCFNIKFSIFKKKRRRPARTARSADAFRKTFVNEGFELEPNGSKREIISQDNPLFNRDLLKDTNEAAKNSGWSDSESGIITYDPENLEIYNNALGSAAIGLLVLTAAIALVSLIDLLFSFVFIMKF